LKDTPASNSPKIARWRQKYKDKGLVILGITKYYGHGGQQPDALRLRHLVAVTDIPIAGGQSATYDLWWMLHAVAKAELNQ